MAVRAGLLVGYVAAFGPGGDEHEEAVEEEVEPIAADDEGGTEWVDREVGHGHEAEEGDDGYAGTGSTFEDFGESFGADGGGAFAQQLLEDLGGFLGGDALHAEEGSDIFFVFAPHDFGAGFSDGAVAIKAAGESRMCGRVGGGR